MAFANLFTSLSVIGEDVKGPREAAFTPRGQSGGDGKSNARKRKPKPQRSSPQSKKRRYQDHRMDAYTATSFKYTDLKAVHSNIHNTSYEHASTGFTAENNHRNKADHTDMFQKGRNYSKNKCNVNRQQQERVKTKKGQKNQNYAKDQRKNTNGDGRHHRRENLRSGGNVWKHKHGTRNVQVKFQRPMTQEFMDQNALSVDGLLLCRHHLWGKCIKGDDCQLKHIQGYNDLIKEVCKFYIQGFCMKGESCPYMHKSFPCKFFHRNGKCSQGADCRFSHEPLNEVTKKLLDEVLKREDDLYQLASKAEQDASEQPAKTDESEITATASASEGLTRPLMPNFYNSDQTNAEKEALPRQDDGPSNNLEPCPTQTQPHSPPSTESVQEAPVCYSVEAVLGRQHFKPFPSFTARLGQQSASFPSPEFTSSSVDQRDVPYSVDAFLRSYKSTENSPLGCTPFPPAAQTECGDVTEVSPHQVNAGLLSKTCSDPTLVSGDRTKPAGEIPESPKLDPPVSHHVKLGLLHLPFTVAQKPSQSNRDMKETTRLTDVTCSLNTEGKSNLPFAKGKSLTCSPKHVPQLKPHVSAQTSVTQASLRSVGSSTGLSESKSGAAVSAAPATSCDKTADSGSSASRFLRRTSKAKHVKTAANPEQTSTRSFLDLFAAPLLPAPVSSQPQAQKSGSASCSQESNPSVGVSHFTDSRQSASDLETPQKCHVKIDETSHRPLSPTLPASPKNENVKSLNQREERRVDPTCVLRGSLSDISSSPASCGSTEAATANSVLRSLFLCLSPYQQDGDGLQPGVPSESEKKEIGAESVFVKTQPKNRRKGRRQKELKSCSEKPVAHPTKPQPFFQTPQTSLEATGGSTLCSPAPFKPLVRSCGAHVSPASAVQHHTQSKLRRATEAGQRVDGDKVATPLKDLFKTLDTTVFHFGH